VVLQLQQPALLKVQLPVVLQLQQPALLKVQLPVVHLNK
jgi:hypothetical protein